MVNLRVGDLLTFLVCLFLALGNVVDETALESSGKDFFLVRQEGCHTFVLQFADDAGSHVNHFLVFVSHFFVDDALAYLLLDIFIEETQQQVLRLGKGKNLELMGVFDVHDFVADIVSSFYHIYKWMAGVFERLTRCRFAKNAQFIGNFPVRFRFGSKETEFAVVVGKTACKRVFYDGSKHGIGHHEASLTAPLEPVGQDSEGICVAFEMRNIIPKLR